jgi:hypothetical protein
MDPYTDVVLKDSYNPVNCLSGFMGRASSCAQVHHEREWLGKVKDLQTSFHSLGRD